MYLMRKWTQQREMPNHKKYKNITSLKSVLSVVFSSYNLFFTNNIVFLEKYSSDYGSRFCNIRDVTIT